MAGNVELVATFHKPFYAFLVSCYICIAFLTHNTTKEPPDSLQQLSFCCIMTYMEDITVMQHLFSKEDISLP